MKKELLPSPVDTGLKSELEQATFYAAQKAPYEPSPTLRALSRMLIKNRRIAQVLGISQAAVSAMLLGKQPCPPKHEPKLRHLLRTAITAAKQTCDRAERKELLYRNTEYSASSIAFMRERIAEAEELLKKEPQQ